MARVLHYLLYGMPEHRLERLHDQFGVLASARGWRCGEPWVASSQSRGLFQMEFFRHLKNEEGKGLSAEYRIHTSIRDEDHPLAKLRRLDFASGRLPSGQSLEDVLAKRPVIKKVE